MLIATLQYILIIILIFQRCKIYFYLEDDSIQVIEPKLQNSGIPQGKCIQYSTCFQESIQYVSKDFVFIWCARTVLLTVSLSCCITVWAKSNKVKIQSSKSVIVSRALRKSCIEGWNVGKLYFDWTIIFCCCFLSCYNVPAYRCNWSPCQERQVWLASKIDLWNVFSSLFVLNFLFRNFDKKTQDSLASSKWWRILHSWAFQCWKRYQTLFKKLSPHGKWEIISGATISSIRILNTSTVCWKDMSI